MSRGGISARNTKTYIGFVCYWLEWIHWLVENRVFSLISWVLWFHRKTMYAKSLESQRGDHVYKSAGGGSLLKNTCLFFVLGFRIPPKSVFFWVFSAFFFFPQSFRHSDFEVLCENSRKTSEKCVEWETIAFLKPMKKCFGNFVGLQRFSKKKNVFLPLDTAGCYCFARGEEDEVEGLPIHRIRGDVKQHRRNLG